MQHGRASSAIAARSFVGRSRIMSLLMALFLFAGIGLAIPGFSAHADDAPRYGVFEGGLLRAAMSENSDFAAEHVKTGFWGLILDHGQVTPLQRPTFTRNNESATAYDPDLWAAASLDDPTLMTAIPNGTNNVEGIKWTAGTVHTVTLVMYRSDSSGVEPNPVTYTVMVNSPYVDNIDDPTPAPTADPTAAPTDDPTTSPARTAEPAPTAEATLNSAHPTSSCERFATTTLYSPVGRPVRSMVTLLEASTCSQRASPVCMMLALTQSPAAAFSDGTLMVSWPAVKAALTPPLFESVS